MLLSTKRPTVDHKTQMSSAHDMMSRPPCQVRCVQLGSIEAANTGLGA